MTKRQSGGGCLLSPHYSPSLGFSDSARSSSSGSHSPYGSPSRSTSCPFFPICISRPFLSGIGVHATREPTLSAGLSLSRCSGHISQRWRISACISTQTCGTRDNTVRASRRPNYPATHRSTTCCAPPSLLLVEPWCSGESSRRLRLLSRTSSYSTYSMTPSCITSARG